VRRNGVTVPLARFLALCHSALLDKKPRRDTTRCEASRSQQARLESNQQPPVLEPTPSNAGVAAFVGFQGLSSEPPTPASLDNAGVGTNPGTEESQLQVCAPRLIQALGTEPSGLLSRLPAPVDRVRD
jgi:hypothetical protein